jgi:hypothetical protein
LLLAAAKDLRLAASHLADLAAIHDLSRKMSTIDLPEPRLALKRAGLPRDIQPAKIADNACANAGVATHLRCHGRLARMHTRQSYQGIVKKGNE